MTSCESDERHAVEMTVDGRRIRRYVSPRLLLLDFLRTECGATGVHAGCEHGVCGACTVKVDGRVTRSCLMFAIQADGGAVETVASLGTRDALSPLQEAFRARHALQCGFCTPGILVSAQAFLDSEEHPDERSVREMLSGHLCRCTGYAPIVAAVLDAAAQRER
ncbi:MAG: 2-furoyl-CoA dehydrogenase 2Fe-2S iron sulfur subunit [Candidatus Eremiobacteraeota bacterium]|jgi:2-furoyl-CoA dehydrogenase 2Fe-2S iron sulfur subunit|nr:2-furoyl-CoA dehydrogenase 2Fe-2S iron sulfur subunit [Candidatus Eremiobacteraeota bacterium]